MPSHTLCTPSSLRRSSLCLLQGELAQDRTGASGSAGHALQLVHKSNHGQVLLLTQAFVVCMQGFHFIFQFSSIFLQQLQRRLRSVMLSTSLVQLLLKGVQLLLRGACIALKSPEYTLSIINLTRFPCDLFF